MSDDKNRKIVNTEEQNRTVNPSDRETASSSDEPLFNTTGNSGAETERPDSGSEIETPHRIEGDDAGAIERKIPNL